MGKSGEHDQTAKSAGKNFPADFLMKGLVDTNIFLKAILNKETGLPVHGLLSHVMTFDTLGAYHKLMLTSDGGMVLYPTLEQKIGLTKTSTIRRAALRPRQPVARRPWNT